MTAPLTISRAEPEELGLSYARLREEGVRLLQEMSGLVWTDYNEHDPGVTILEQLCYALTELSYRAGLPVADLLAGQGGVIDLARHGLFPPRDAFPCAPLTLADHRRLLVDRVPGAGNAWVFPVAPAGARPVAGLYDIALYMPNVRGPDPCACDDAASPREACERALRVYAAHRGLCEDVRAVFVLSPVRTTVRARVTIDDSRPPETIVAELYYKIGLLLAPEPRREPLRAALDRGLSPSELFEGPLLHDGFIDPASLDDRASLTDLCRPVGLTEITRLIARTPGVIGARDVSARVADRSEVSGNGFIAAPRKGVLVLDSRPNASGDFSVRVLRRGAPCKLDPSRVLRELDRRWSEHRRRYPLAAQYDEAFPPPAARARDLAHYTSIQQHFPDTYGINAYGPPDDATDERRAKARQLKGYLAVFEQLMADYFARIANLDALYSTARAAALTACHASLLGSIPDAADVLDPHYERKLEAAASSPGRTAAQRQRVLDFLLALHADGLTLPAAATAPGQEDGEGLLQAKNTLLEDLLSVQGRRGLGMDYTAPPSSHDIAGMELRCRIELGLPLPAPAGQQDRAAERADGPRLYLVEHTLLRLGRFLRGKGQEAAQAERQGPFEYSFTVTAVFSSSSGAGGAAFEQAVRDVLRRAAPAHIAIELLPLNTPRMRRFEELYGEWREALHLRAGRRIIVSSMRLRSFLRAQGGDEGQRAAQ